MANAEIAHPVSFPHAGHQQLGKQPSGLPFSYILLSPPQLPLSAPPSRFTTPPCIVFRCRRINATQGLCGANMGIAYYKHVDFYCCQLWIDESIPGLMHIVAIYCRKQNIAFDAIVIWHVLVSSCSTYAACAGKYCPFLTADLLLPVPTDRYRILSGKQNPPDDSEPPQN